MSAESSTRVDEVRRAAHVRVQRLPPRWVELGETAFWHLVPLVPFLLLRSYLSDRTALPEDAYRDDVVAWAFVGSLPIWEVAALVAAGAVLVWRTDVLAGWSAWSDGATPRIVVGVTSAVLTWWVATGEPNPFFGEAYPIDRALLVGLAVAIWWRPVFVGPFLVVLLAFDGQFDHPLHAHSVAQITLPVNVLLLFVAALVVRAIARRPMSEHFVFLTLCAVAASYVVPGIGKLELGWLGHRHVFLTVFSSHSVGWLGTAGSSTIETIARWMEALDWPIVVLTLVVECGAVLLLLRRAVAICWLAGFVALHTMILVTSGIWFWTWIVLDATLLVVLARRGTSDWSGVFSTAGFVISLPVILLGSVLFRPVELAWLDAPINYTYRLEAITESGDRQLVPISVLAPYDTQLALGDFGYLDERPQLGVVWGAVHDRELAARLLDARTDAEVLAIEARFGRSAHDEVAASEFDRFVRAAIGRWSTEGSPEAVLHRVPAPPQVWLSSEAGVSPPDDVVVAVDVHQLLWFYDGAHQRVVRDRVVRTIELEPTR